MTDFVAEQTVFFVDDDPQLRAANTQSLELAGIDVRAFADAPSALAELDTGFAGAIVSDIRMPRMDGLQFFQRVREIDPEIPVILITGHADVPTAIAALRDGAADFLTKPFAADHLVAAVSKALAIRRLVIDNRRLRAAADGGDSPLIGQSSALTRLREAIAQVARADIDVLVEGETGTGKELVARLLHRQGPRRGKPFVAVNCGAVPEALAEQEFFGHEGGAVAHGRLERPGRIEASHGGTLFLDEIDSMSLGVQAKLLRVIEEREVVRLGGDTVRPVNLRIVAAAKRDLAQMVEAGSFRQDLYYRLNVVRLRVPPLRERRADVPELFAHFVAEASERVGAGPFWMSDAVRRRLVEHDWPGNVRELRNFAFAALLELPSAAEPPPADAPPLAKRVDAFEAGVIRDTLAATGGDIRATTEALSVPRKTLYDKMSRHGIEPKAYRHREEGTPE
jgi:two-component system, NtrC family, C4-dicarboxylate transport response regulator DctD